MTFIVAGASVAAAAPYGTAGCGLGSMAFHDQKGPIQIIAATLNGLFGTQTFGITSGTSNCADTGGGVASAKAFIQTNREALAKDISRGGGETVANLATLSGCADAHAVGSTLQLHFATIFPSATVSDVDVSDSVVGVLRADATLACTRLQ
jgi:hypothetical protein